MRVEASPETVAGRRPAGVLLLAIVFIFLGLILAGMAFQNFTWNEFKPGKPMDPDLLPWSIGLLALGATLITTAIGLLRMRIWGRRGALLMGSLLVGVTIYGLTEDAPLLALLITPAFCMALGVIYLLRPATAAAFR